MAVTSLVISVLALLIAGAALWYSHRQAVAAERSADADQRSVTLAEAEAAKYAIPWVLRLESGDTFVLANDSDEPVFDVKLDLGDIGIVRGELTHARIGPGSAVRFTAPRAFGQQTETVIVTWRRLGEGPVLDWQYPLPEKPRR